MSFDIDKSLNKIKNAVYGKDVRQAIYDCIYYIKQSNEGTFTLNAASKDKLGGIKLGDLFTLDANLNLIFSENINNQLSKIDNQETNIASINNEIRTLKQIQEKYAYAFTVVNILSSFPQLNQGLEDARPTVVNLLASLANNGGGTLYFPNGTYYFSWSFNVPSNVRILGETNTVFTAERYGNAKRHSTFIRCGDENGNIAGYNAFKNVTIENIIFDMGGIWSLNGTTLTYKAKYDTNNTYTSNDYLSYCPIVAAHGDGLVIKNCTFKNGIYAGYTGSSGTASNPVPSTNPHVMDLIAIRNLIIDGCVFEPVFTTYTAITNWNAKASGETAESDVNYSDMIQLDAAYGGGGDGTSIHLPSDNSNCKNIIIRNCRFYGLPRFDWKTVINNTGDDDSKFRTEFFKCDSSGKDTTTKIKANLTAFRFSPVAAIGGCHEFGTTDKLALQPENVEIYNNIFEGTWSSHYAGINAHVQIRWGNYDDAYKDSQGYYYPLFDDSPEVHLVKKEPARHGCHGAIYAMPGAKGYDIHHNIFKESDLNNKTTAVFLYGSKAGCVHDNTFINYGEPLPAGTKSLAMSTYVFPDNDLWNKSKTGYYDGLLFCNASNNLWVRDTYAPNILSAPNLATITKLNE